MLGSTDFVDQIRRAVETAEAPRPGQLPLDALVARVCAQVGIAPPVLAAGGRTPQASRARAGVAYLWLTVLGGPAPECLPCGRSGPGCRRRVGAPPGNVLNMATSRITGTVSFP